MNIRPCWWICFKQSTPGRKILLLLTIIIWRMGILKVDDSCKGTLEWNLPKQIWHITLYKSTISGQISSRSFVTPIFAGADLGSASATVPEMFPTPRAGQSMKICVLIKKGSGLTDARLWVRSCEYLQWTFHCFRRLLLRHVFRTGFSTLLVWALAIWYFLHGSGFPHHHPEDSFSAGHLECGFQLPREFDCLGYWSRRARVLAFFFCSKKRWKQWTYGTEVLKNEICIFFWASQHFSNNWMIVRHSCCWDISHNRMKLMALGIGMSSQMLHPSLMQCRWEKFWEESNIDGFQHCYPAWGTKTMLRLQGLCKISLLHIESQWMLFFALTT